MKTKIKIDFPENLYYRTHVEWKLNRMAKKILNWRPYISFA